MSVNEMSGGEAIARMIRAFEGGPMFGMGGFQLLPFYDAARRLELQHFLINDERAGVFAADAYAKVSGKVGLVDATLGPGATNLVTGLLEALNAGTPMVALVGDTHRDHSWKNMTQESRQIRDGRNAARYQLVNEGGCCDAADGVEAEKLQGSLDCAYRLNLPVIRRVGNLEHSGGQDGMCFNLGGQLLSGEALVTKQGDQTRG